MTGDDQVRHLNQMVDPEELSLDALQVLDLDEIDNFDDLLQAMSKTAFGGRNLGEALDVLEVMVSDPECHVVATFSGAMTVAKMGKLICKMIDQGWVQSVVSTGALMAHGFIESIGLKHYKYVFGQLDDSSLCRAGLNRVYDTLEPERNFIQAEEVIYAVLEELQDQDLCSYKITQAIGSYLNRHFSGPGILKSAFRKEVPVYIPAFTDSELALDVAMYFLKKFPRVREDMLAVKNYPFQFNPFLDLFHYTKRIIEAKRIGIFTIGGGVPRNWAQQVGPFIEMAWQGISELEWPLRRFQYGVRICPEPVHWGGLSGCTYQEGVSWGKFVPREDGGRFAEVFCDATIAWPILIKGLMDRLARKK